METNLNQPIFDTSDSDFRDAIIPGKFVRLEYLTDLSEFIKADVTIKQLTRENNVESLELATGRICTARPCCKRFGQVIAPAIRATAITPATAD